MKKMGWKVKGGPFSNSGSPQSRTCLRVAASAKAGKAQRLIVFVLSGERPDSTNARPSEILDCSYRRPFFLAVLSTARKK